MFDFSGYEYADVRIESGESLRVSSRDEISIAAGPFYGIAARVLENGSWGFVSTNSREADVGGLLKKAKRLAGLAKGNVRIRQEKKETRKEAAKTEWVDADEMIRQINAAKRETLGPKTVSSNLTFSASVLNREFYSSEGREVREDESHFYFSCGVIARSGGITQIGVETAASRSGADRIDVLETARTAKKRAEMLLDARPAPKGRFAAVLDPEITGTFIHEAVGHAAEADAIISGESVFTKAYGKKVGNELVNIVDDPALPYFGGYKYDDEGIAGKRVDVIKRGVLSGFLNSRETAAETGHALNGHARAEGYASQPVVRMSNTIFLPGSHSREEVFDIRDGIYVKGSLGGSVDIFSGGFMFKAKEGREIKNGEAGEQLRDVVIIGNINEVLSSIVAVGKDFETHPGMCGKNGQMVPVEDGGPHIRVANITIG